MGSTYRLSLPSIEAMEYMLKDPSRCPPASLYTEPPKKSSLPLRCLPTVDADNSKLRLGIAGSRRGQVDSIDSLQMFAGSKRFRKPKPVTKKCRQFSKQELIPSFRNVNSNKSKPVKAKVSLPVGSCKVAAKEESPKDSGFWWERLSEKRKESKIENLKNENKHKAYSCADYGSDMKSLKSLKTQMSTNNGSSTVPKRIPEKANLTYTNRPIEGPNRNSSKIQRMRDHTDTEDNIHVQTCSSYSQNSGYHIDTVYSKSKGRNCGSDSQEHNEEGDDEYVNNLNTCLDISRACIDYIEPIHNEVEHLSHKNYDIQKIKSKPYEFEQSKMLMNQTEKYLEANAAMVFDSGFSDEHICHEPYTKPETSNYTNTPKQSVNTVSVNYEDVSNTSQTKDEVLPERQNASGDGHIELTMELVNSSGVIKRPNKNVKTRGLNSMRYINGADTDKVHNNKMIEMQRINTKTTDVDDTNKEIIVDDFPAKNCNEALILESGSLLYTDISVSSNSFSSTENDKSSYLTVTSDLVDLDARTTSLSVSDDTSGESLNTKSQETRDLSSLHFYNSTESSSSLEGASM